MTDKTALIRIVAAAMAFLALSAGSAQAGTIAVGAMPQGGATPMGRQKIVKLNWPSVDLNVSFVHGLAIHEQWRGSIIFK